MKQPQSNQSGFSLVELLVAVMILAVGLLGLAELQITATKANSHSDTMLAASAIAQEVIEEIAALDSGDDLFDFAVSDATWDGSPVTVAGGGTYDITYDVALDHEGVTNLCKITVTVQSAEQVMSVFGLRTQTVTASTIKRAT